MEISPIIIISTLIFVTITTIVTVFKQQARGSLLGLVFVLIFWILANLFISFYIGDDQNLLYFGVSHFSITSASTLSLYFLLKVTNRAIWVNTRTLLFFTLEPLAFQLIFWGILLTNPNNQQIDTLSNINLIYTICILTAGLVFLLDTLFHKSRKEISKYGLMALAAFLPIPATSTMILFGSNYTQNYIIQASFILTIMLYYWTSQKQTVLDDLPITRDSIVETMIDGWMVIDNNDRIVDINLSAEKMLNISRGGSIGNLLRRTINEWPTNPKLKNKIGELELRRGIASQNKWKYLNAHLSQLVHKNRDIGYLILWRDITARKLEEQERQSEKDELFVILNALSGMANRSVKLEEFLSDAAYQILYTFNSQAMAIYLMDELDGKFGNQLRQITNLGFSIDNQKHIKADLFIEEINGWLTSNKGSHPAVFTKENKETDHSINLQKLGYENYALIPLVVYTQNEKLTLGCILITRETHNHFSNDDLIRLTAITNQISALIDSNSKREFTIALSERRRLLRDLHDSVSQKLYGLVALTEAAQAAIEVGSEIAPQDVLTRIGENARQAVKEMRLFLYEMQPVDLKDGLVSSLHHRLAAVEGRADIKARLLTDEKIQASKDVETALYFIAQEALNNILRHAHAKNVTVKLTNKRQKIVLEVLDDGTGFDSSELDESGLGIKNMKERTLQLNGKFDISSEKGQGTMVTVTINKKEHL